MRCRSKSKRAATNFARGVDLARRDEPGLSVVIPYPDAELTAAKLLPSVVQHYFIPIVAGDLTVELVHDGKIERIDSASLSSLLARAGWDKQHQFRSTVELARWGLGRSGTQSVELPAPSVAGAPKWDDAALVSALEPLKDAFDRGERIALSVPVVVKPVDRNATLARFEVFPRAR